MGENYRVVRVKYRLNPSKEHKILLKIIYGGGGPKTYWDSFTTIQMTDCTLNQQTPTLMELYPTTNKYGHISKPLGSTVGPVELV